MTISVLPIAWPCRGHRHHHHHRPRRPLSTAMSKDKRVASEQLVHGLLSHWLVVNQALPWCSQAGRYPGLSSLVPAAATTTSSTATPLPFPTAMSKDKRVASEGWMVGVRWFKGHGRRLQSHSLQGIVGNLIQVVQVARERANHTTGGKEEGELAQRHVRQ